MSNVRVASGLVKNMLATDSTIVNVTGPNVYKDSPWGFVQTSVVGTAGVCTATSNFFGSNDGINWGKTALATHTLSGTSSDSDGTSIISTCKYIRVVISNVTGTGSVVTCSIGL